MEEPTLKAYQEEAVKHNDIFNDNLPKYISSSTLDAWNDFKDHYPELFI